MHYRCLRVLDLSESRPDFVDGTAPSREQVENYLHSPRSGFPLYDEDYYDWFYIGGAWVNWLTYHDAIQVSPTITCTVCNGTGREGRYRCHFCLEGKLLEADQSFLNRRGVALPGIPDPAIVPFEMLTGDRWKQACSMHAWFWPSGGVSCPSVDAPDVPERPEGGRYGDPAWRAYDREVQKAHDRWTKAEVVPKLRRFKALARKYPGRYYAVVLDLHN